MRLIKSESKIYIIGISILGVGYYFLKNMIDNDVVFVFLVILYLVFLSFIAKKLKK